LRQVDKDAKVLPKELTVSHSQDRKINNCAVIGGNGAVGTMFVGFLRADGVDVQVIDLVAPDATDNDSLARITGDITHPTSEMAKVLRSVDCVLFAVPEGVTLAGIDAISSIVSNDVLIAHTCSVQGPVATKLEELGQPLESVGFNPMFGPSLPPRGRPVAAIVVRDGPLVRHLISIVERTGARVIETNATEHDRVCSVSQAATHAAIFSFGLSLLDSGVSIEVLAQLAPPPCVTLLSLLARIATAAPEVYWDVQAENPNGTAARRALTDGQLRLNHFIDVGSYREFEDALGEIATYFGAGLEYFAGVGQGLLLGLPKFSDEGFSAR
jgi:prephenate dehydrogenase